MPSPNIKQVFKKTMEAVSNGQQINQTQISRDCGYSESSARSQKPFRTKEFQELLAQIDDKDILKRFKQIVKQGKDRDSISAGKELLLLKRRYPDKTLVHSLENDIKDIIV